MIDEEQHVGHMLEIVTVTGIAPFARCLECQEATA